MAHYPWDAALDGPLPELHRRRGLGLAWWPRKDTSIFSQTYWTLPNSDAELLAKWSRIIEVRALVNKAIEDVRTQGQLGSSLQAEVVVQAAAEDLALLLSLGDDLKFVLITSAAQVVAGDELAVQVIPSGKSKCGRCWHWRADVGADAAHTDLCGRCVSNLYGAGEHRAVA